MACLESPCELPMWLSNANKGHFPSAGSHFNVCWLVASACTVTPCITPRNCISDHVTTCSIETPPLNRSLRNRPMWNYELPANASSCHLHLLHILYWWILSLLLDFLISSSPNYGWENKTHPVSSLISPQSWKTAEIPYNWTQYIPTGSEILCITWPYNHCSCVCIQL